MTNWAGSIKASAIHPIKAARDMQACPRCGRDRMVRKAASGKQRLCSDCKYTMTAEEIAEWQ